MQSAKLSVYCIIEARDVSVFTNLEIDLLRDQQDEKCTIVKCEG